ncbi:MAG: type II secretion system F family protein [Candidatus Kariarchaeaceae archaeon]|jgi:flagellar protein FlaJ
MSKADEQFETKLKSGKKGLGRNALIWFIAFTVAFGLLVIGALDYSTDYTFESGLGDQPQTYTLTADDGSVETTTVQPIYGYGSYKNPDGGFLPDIGFTIHDWIVLALIVALGIPSVMIYQREGRRLDGIDNNLPYLLREIADSQRIGMHLPRAIAEAAKRNYGPLTEELKKLAAKVSWGIPFRDAMMAFRNSLDTPLARQATILILEAERSGGELEQIFESAKNYVQELLDIKKERESSIKPYMYIIFISYVIFCVVIYVLFTTFFAPFGVEEILVEGEPVVVVPLEVFKVLFLYMLITQGFFSGLTAGKMGRGSIKLGLFYSTILMGIGLFFHKVLLIPSVKSIEQGG